MFEIAAAAIIARAGGQVRCAASGREALEALQTDGDDIDLVMLDLQMPEMSGFEALKAARALGYEGPMIAFTAQAMKGEREHVLRSGFDAYVSKPIDTRALLSVLSQQLSNETRILLVEDYADAAVALSMLLEAPGRGVRVAGSAREAQQVAAQWAPTFAWWTWAFRTWRDKSWSSACGAARTFDKRSSLRSLEGSSRRKSWSVSTDICSSR